MVEISRTTLFGKLGTVTYKTIESATLFCKMRGNRYVELAHWLHQLLEQGDADLPLLLRGAALDAARLARDLTETLDRLPRGATSVSDLAPQVEESVERGWVYATLLFGEYEVRSGHLLVGWLKTSTLRNALFAISGEFKKLKVDDVVERLKTLDSAEARAKKAEAPAGSAGAGDGDGTISPAALGKQEALNKFSTDLTAREERRDGPHHGPRRRNPPDHPGLDAAPAK